MFDENAAPNEETTQEETTQSEIGKPRPPQLPSNTEDMLALRRSMKPKNLNDYVDDIHVALWADPTYRMLLEAVYDEDAVEGSCRGDTWEAAGMIRNYAEEHSIKYVSRPRKKATIVKSLTVVLRRYQMTRGERRSSVKGDIVGSNGDGE